MTSSLNPTDIAEIWSISVNPSDFFNVERVARSGDGGGGQTYFQIPQSRVDDTLKFLGARYEDLPISIVVISVGPGTSDSLTFQKKSMGRMRIGPQNRQRGHRLAAWSPTLSGFPALPDNVSDRLRAEEKLDEIGGIRLFLARTSSGEVYAGYVVGESAPSDFGLWEFNHILFGNDTKGGYWKKDGQ